jgi:hypothetical protein
MLPAVRAATVRLALAALWVGSLACERREPAPATREQPALREPAAQPKAQSLVAPAAEPDAAPPSTRRSQAVARAELHRCAARTDHELAEGTRVWVGSRGEGIAVVASPRALTLFAIEGGTVSKRAIVAVDAPSQRGALVCGTSCELAVVDEKARLVAYQLERDALRERGVLASGVDRRFAPALLQSGARIAYAYTRTVDETMHTLVTPGKGEPALDVTPAGHGAAAPTVLLGEKLPTLVVIDARAGVSPLLEIPFDAELAPRPAIVRTPVSQPFAPPALSALAWPSGKAEAFYSLTGRLAMTAIGRVPLRKAEEPKPLAASRGYGELEFSAVLDGDVALIAVEVPSATPPTAKRTILLKLAREHETHDAISVESGGEATRPSLAVRGDREYLLGYVSGGRAHVVELGCTP